MPYALLLADACNTAHWRARKEVLVVVVLVDCGGSLAEMQTPLVLDRADGWSGPRIRCHR